MPTLTASSASVHATAATPPLLSAAPPGPGLRRSANGNGTNGNGAPLRQRSNLSAADLPSPVNGNGFDHTRRRYSTISSDPDSFDIRSIAHDFPPELSSDKPVRQQLLNWQSLPLVLALLPAIAGLLFKNGSDFVTDALLLALAAIILHAAITKPWTWYHLAQEIRMVNQVSDIVHEMSEDDESPSCEDDESLDEYSFKTRTRTRPGPRRRKASPVVPKLTDRQKVAMAELRIHEAFALVACFAFPVLGAFLLHLIRSQLSRPSEGLVSDYNLAVFILAAEIRPVRHLLCLFEARTWHIQRIVTSNPYLVSEPQSVAAQLDQLSERLEQLETRAAADETDAASEATSQRREAILRDAKTQIQPEVKALYRTVRQFEKKYIVLAVQVDNRLHLLDRRIEDAITVAAHAAKSCRPRPSLLRTTSEQTLGLLLLPLQITRSLLYLPFRLVGTAIEVVLGVPRRADHGYRSGRSSRSSSAGGERSSRASSRR